jgi:hypothetical protein
MPSTSTSRPSSFTFTFARNTITITTSRSTTFFSLVRANRTFLVSYNRFRRFRWRSSRFRRRRDPYSRNVRRMDRGGRRSSRNWGLRVLRRCLSSVRGRGSRDGNSRRKWVYRDIESIWRRNRRNSSLGGRIYWHKDSRRSHSNGGRYNRNIGNLNVWR